MAADLQRLCGRLVFALALIAASLFFSSGLQAQFEPEDSVEEKTQKPKTKRSATKKRRTRTKTPKAKKPIANRDAKSKKAADEEVPEIQQALLVLSVNGVRHGEIQVTIKNGDVWAPVAALEETKLPSFEGKRDTMDGEEYVSLTSLQPETNYILDERELSLQLHTSRVVKNHTEVDFRAQVPEAALYDKDTSAFFNYNLRTMDFDRGTAFGELGVSFNGNLLYSGVSANTDGQVVRGLTNLTMDYPDKLVRVIAGDSFTRGGPLGASRLIGGVKIAREFTLDPYFIRFPSPTVTGAVQSPSTVEVYVGDRLVRTADVNPGSFELQNVPVLQGASASRVIIRDAFGRQQEVSNPYYFSGTNLKKGLHEYNYSAGVRRNAIGRSSLDYSDPALQGFHRIGITNWITPGLNVEASENLVSGGGLSTIRTPFGVIDLAFSGSYEIDVAGYAGSLGYTYQSRYFSAGGFGRAHSDSFANLTLPAARDRSRYEGNVFVSVPLVPRTSLSVRYNGAHTRDDRNTNRVSFLGSVNLGDSWNLIGNFAYERLDGEESYEGFLMLTHSFGDQTTGSVSHNQNNEKFTESLQVQRSMNRGEDYGYRVDLQAGETERVNVLGQGQTEFGRYEASVGRSNGTNQTMLSASGGLVLIGGGLFPTRPVYGSYALIKVPDAKGVRGYHNHQEMGTTDSDGDLLIPNLMAYHANRLSIAADDVPIDFDIGETEIVAAPPYRGGLVARFDAKRMKAVAGVVKLTLGEEKVVPKYGELNVQVENATITSPLGEGGEFYLENLEMGSVYPAQVVFGDNVCEFELNLQVTAEDYPRFDPDDPNANSSDSVVTDIGDVRCKGEPDPEIEAEKARKAEAEAKKQAEEAKKKRREARRKRRRAKRRATKRKPTKDK